MKGFAEWHNRDYLDMGDPFEIMGRDPNWEADLRTMRQIVEHKRPKKGPGE